MRFHNHQHNLWVVSTAQRNRAERSKEAILLPLLIIKREAGYKVTVHQTSLKQLIRSQERNLPFQIFWITRRRSTWVEWWMEFLQMLTNNSVCLQAAQEEAMLSNLTSLQDLKQQVTCLQAIIIITTTIINRDNPLNNQGHNRSIWMLPKKLEEVTLQTCTLNNQPPPIMLRRLVIPQCLTSNRISSNSSSNNSMAPRPSNRALKTFKRCSRSLRTNCKRLPLHPSLQVPFKMKPHSLRS